MTYDKGPRCYDRDRARRSRFRAALRGVLAVAGFLAGALDALITARVGLPRLTYLARRLGQELASEYRRGRAGAIDIDAKECP